MNQILLQSLIDADLWNTAHWTATAFLHDPSGEKPPFMGLVFENIQAGRKIFEDLRGRIGTADRFEELYVSIVEGEILGEASGYTVHVSSDPARTQSRLKAEGRDLNFDQAIVLSRFHRMTPPPDSPHLSKFR